MVQRVSAILLAAVLATALIGCNAASPAVDVTGVHVLDQTE